MSFIHSLIGDQLSCCLVEIPCCNQVSINPERQKRPQFTHPERRIVVELRWRPKNILVHVGDQRMIAHAKNQTTELFPKPEQLTMQGELKELRIDKKAISLRMKEEMTVEELNNLILPRSEQERAGSLLVEI
jgi:hypothetical protein